MWPWSTIRSLKLELTQAERANAYLHKTLEDAANREIGATAQIRTLTTKVGSYETSLKEAGRQADEVRAERDTYAEEILRLKEALWEKGAEAELWERSYHSVGNKFDAAREEVAQAAHLIAELRAQLAKAAKNDQRDARGRFTKAVSAEVNHAV